MSKLKLKKGTDKGRILDYLKKRARFVRKKFRRKLEKDLDEELTEAEEAFFQTVKKVKKIKKKA